MKVQVSRHAVARELTIELWWRQNRLDAPDLFSEELIEALAYIEDFPEVPPIFKELDGYPVRRVLLKKTRQWVYYTVRRDLGIILIETIWGTSRDDPPPL